jgi:hypothetical protein
MHNENFIVKCTLTRSRNLEMPTISNSSYVCSNEAGKQALNAGSLGRNGIRSYVPTSALISKSYIIQHGTYSILLRGSACAYSITQVKPKITRMVMCISIILKRRGPKSNQVILNNVMLLQNTLRPHRV